MTLKTLKDPFKAVVPTLILLNFVTFLIEDVLFYIEVSFWSRCEV